MKRPREVIQPRWGVYALRKKAERLGSVQARDEKAAIERALQELESPSTARNSPSKRKLPLRTSGDVRAMFDFVPQQPLAPGEISAIQNKNLGSNRGPPSFSATAGTPSSLH
jgi:hypothetical protein